MAIWQYECYIIPIRKNLLDLKHEQMISWKGRECSQQEVDFLDLKESWSKDIVQYGDLERTCIEFIYEGNELTEIECRMDLRNFSREIFNEILKYVKSINAFFLCDNKVVLPVEEDVINQIKISEAYKFCNKPIEFLMDRRDKEKYLDNSID